MDYLKGGKEAQTAWFAYKEAVKNTTRPAKSVVDFVAGFNAGKGKGTPMTKSSKIVLEQLSYDPKKYKVKKLVNRVTPEVGAIIKRDDVEQLQREFEDLTIEITPAKR